MNDSDIHPGGREFVQAREQIRFALRLKQVVKRAHLGFVVRAAFDFIGAVVGQLAIGRRAVTLAVELRLDAQPLARFGRVNSACVGAGRP